MLPRRKREESYAHGAERIWEKKREFPASHMECVKNVEKNLIKNLIIWKTMRKKMNNCIFCKIINRKIPADIVYEDDDIVAFNDINPKAPVHILIIPKKHIESVDDLTPEDEKLVGKMIYTAQRIAREKGINKDGYRLVFNVRSHGGQVVEHIHLHLLGGQKLGSMV